MYYTRRRHPRHSHTHTLYDNGSTVHGQKHVLYSGDDKHAALHCDAAAPDASLSASGEHGVGTLQSSRGMHHIPT
jgi:hypothetical protein